MDGAGELPGDTRISFQFTRNTKFCANYMFPAGKTLELIKWIVLVNCLQQLAMLCVDRSRETKTNCTRAERT